MKSKFDRRSACINLVSLVGVIVLIIAAIEGGLDRCGRFCRDC